MIGNEIGLNTKISEFKEQKPLQTDPLGILTIKVVKGQLIRNTGITGLMNPFIRLTYRNIPYTTSIHKDGGRAPVWNQIFEIPILQQEDVMHIECLN